MAVYTDRLGYNRRLDLEYEFEFRTSKTHYYTKNETIEK